MISLLSIDELRLAVHLGTTDEEQQHAQVVWVQVHMGFSQPPAACKNDELKDTVPYDRLVHFIQAHTHNKRYHLIEALAHDLHQAITTHYTQPQKLWLSVRKHPPLNDVGSCTFSLGDGHPHTWSS